MKCPHCKESPISPTKFMINGLKKRIVCQHCKEELNPSRGMKIVNFMVMILMILFVITYFQSLQLFGFEISFGVWALTLLAIWLVSSWLLWYFGTMRQAN